MRFWNRICRVTIGLSASTGILVDGLDVSFNVKKTLQPEPNKAEIRVWNLNPDHRLAIEHYTEAKPVPVILEAGYEEGTSVIFSGELRSVNSKLDSADVITTLSTGDGEKACRTARVNISIKKETTTDKVIEAVATALGVAKGNLKDATQKLKFSTLGQLFSEGTVISGNAAREMTNLCRSVGLSWSVQDGKLQLIPLTQALAGSAIYLSPETGLIGSPCVNKDRELSCRGLMQPDMFPGRLLVIDSFSHKGQYRIEETCHQGDTKDQDWYVDILAKKY